VSFAFAISAAAIAGPSIRSQSIEPSCARPVLVFFIDLMIAPDTFDELGTAVRGT